MKNQLHITINEISRNDDRINLEIIYHLVDSHDEYKTEITEGEYEKLSSKFPKIDFSRLYLYEESDYTSAAQTVACQGGSCRI